MNNVMKMSKPPEKCPVLISLSLNKIDCKSCDLGPVGNSQAAAIASSKHAGIAISWYLIKPQFDLISSKQSSYYGIFLWSLTQTSPEGFVLFCIRWREAYESEFGLMETTSGNAQLPQPCFCLQHQYEICFEYFHRSCVCHQQKHLKHA